MNSPSIEIGLRPSGEISGANASGAFSSRIYRFLGQSRYPDPVSLVHAILGVQASPEGGWRAHGVSGSHGPESEYGRRELRKGDEHSPIVREGIPAACPVRMSSGSFPLCLYSLLTSPRYNPFALLVHAILGVRAQSLSPPGAWIPRIPWRGHDHDMARLRRGEGPDGYIDMKFPGRLHP